MDALGDRDFWIADRLVRPRRHEIAAAGRSVRIEPRVMRVLLELRRREGEVVSRRELFTAVWGESWVGEEVVTQAISVLRRALGDDATQQRVIATVPKAGYRLVTPICDSAPAKAASAPLPTAGVEPPAGPAVRRAAMAKVAALVALSVTLGIAAGGWLRDEARLEPPRMRALTSLPGREAQPALSPDGRWVAFVRSGAGEWPDLWLQEVDGGTTRRLTRTPALEGTAAWAPAAAQLAFAALSRGRCDLWILSISEGSTRRLGGCTGSYLPELDWSPDGRELAIADALPDGRTVLWLVNAGSGERRSLTGPIQGAGDRYPAFSPQGTEIAFSRTGLLGSADLFVVPRGGGVPRRLTDRGVAIAGLRWSRDGRSLIHSAAAPGGGFGLWSVDRNGGEPRWLGVPLSAAVRPSRATRRERWVVERQDFASGLWALPLRPAGVPRRFAAAASTARDEWPQHAPGGTSVAFASDRGGGFDLWLASGSPARARRLTRLGADRLTPARWSPDGQRIAFSATRRGDANVYVVEIATGTLLAVASSREPEIAPAWTADGSCLWYLGPREGRWAIWRRCLAGGAAERLADLPATSLWASPGGRSLLLTLLDRRGLWEWPLDGSGTVLRAPDLAAGDVADWGVVPGGVYMLRREGGSVARLLMQGHDGGPWRTLATLPVTPDDHGVSLAPDSSMILFGRSDRTESDLVLLEPPMQAGDQRIDADTF